MDTPYVNPKPEILNYEPKPFSGEASGQGALWVWGLGFRAQGFPVVKGLGLGEILFATAHNAQS